MTDYAEIDGVKTPRPKEQDIRPKIFEGKPWPLAIIAFSEPTDRYVLWFIYNYKYAFNVFYTSDYIQWNKPPDGDKSKWPLYKYQIVVKSLMDRGLIKYGDKQRLTLIITRKGNFFRLTTHPVWPVIPVLFAAVVAFTIFGLNKGCTKESTKLESQPSNLKPSDSSQSQSFQTLTEKDSGFSLKQTDTTNIKDSTTKHK